MIGREIFIFINNPLIYIVKHNVTIVAERVFTKCQCQKAAENIGYRYDLIAVFVKHPGNKIYYHRRTSWIYRRVLCHDATD